MPLKSNFFKSRRLLLSVVGVALSVLLVASACSSDDDDNTAAQPPDTTQTTSAPATTVAPATTAAPTTTAAPATTRDSDTPDEVPDSEATSPAPGSLRLPSPLPEGAPGEVIDVEDLGTFSDVAAYRILYHSRNRQGENIAVSGFALVPPGEAPEGGWPVVAYTHGSTGAADECAPSSTIDVDLETFGSLTGDSLLRLAREGYVVAATDYEGLGTPGLHTYIVGENTANAVIDSVRAVQNMEQIDASNSWATVGISQGGHAAIHAGQYGPDYAPELDLKGVISMAPPSQFSFLYDTLVVSPARGYIFMATAAFDIAYENVDVSDVLTPLGVELLDELENGCLDYFFGVVNTYDVDEIVAVDNPLAVPPWDDIARENDVNQRAVTVPLFIAHGGADELIPPVSSSLLLAQLCAFPEQGPTIRIEYPGASHGGVAVDASDDIIDWLDGRFTGEEAPDGCG